MALCVRTRCVVRAATALTRRRTRGCTGTACSRPRGPTPATAGLRAVRKGDEAQDTKRGPRARSREGREAARSGAAPAAIRGRARNAQFVAQMLSKSRRDAPKDATSGAVRVGVGNPVGSPKTASPASTERTKSVHEAPQPGLAAPMPAPMPCMCMAPPGCPSSGRTASPSLSACLRPRAKVHAAGDAGRSWVMDGPPHPTRGAQAPESHVAQGGSAAAAATRARIQYASRDPCRCHAPRRSSDQERGNPPPPAPARTTRRPRPGRGTAGTPSRAGASRTCRRRRRRR